ncbi:putative serine carboxypeptidase-like 53 isoform X1 [Lactuca sativa]|uniref:putative serine carboxypeptidase-like 53 isoform X1 n=1 Tax=Lactuca sativa TaxID=4236 RepID=UPI000CD830CA|nr:putative serine carboxypeptidase-like 53 isoform X1 [Lactuca sativa]
MVTAIASTCCSIVTIPNRLYPYRWCPTEALKSISIVRTSSQLHIGRPFQGKNISGHVLVLVGGCFNLKKEVADGVKEVMPSHVNKDGKSVYLNLSSWNIVTNLFFLHSPIGVGYYHSNTTSDILNAIKELLQICFYFY